MSYKAEKALSGTVSQVTAYEKVLLYLTNPKLSRRFRSDLEGPHTDNSLAKNSQLCFHMYQPLQSLIQRCDASKIQPEEATHRQKPGKTCSTLFRYVSAPSVPHPVL